MKRFLTYLMSIFAMLFVVAGYTNSAIADAHEDTHQEEGEDGHDEGEEEGGEEESHEDDGHHH